MLLIYRHTVAIEFVLNLKKFTERGILHKDRLKKDLGKLKFKFHSVVMLSQDQNYIYTT